MYAIWVILRQKQVTDLQTDFINNMTHEFKTPISSIKLASDYLVNNETIVKDVRLKRYSEVIKEQNSRLNNQVEKVLNIARLEKDQFKLKKERIDLTDFVKMITAQEQMKFDFQKGILTNHLPTEPIYIMADRLHLTNVLSNILDNALKYCQDSPEVQINMSADARMATILISDNGIGINTDDLKKIFDKFYRVSTGNRHDVKGFGLGLFYVKNICDAHNWNIELDSVVGQGTVVKIKLPISHTA